MTDEKENCWQYMKCGREPGGTDDDSKEFCPVSAGNAVNGVNQGINSGRMCWLVAGTFCNTVVQGSFTQKIKSCMDCDFYKKIHADERESSAITNSAEVFAYSHIGNVRKSNEDRYLIKKLEDGSLLLAIADGMGGEVAGDYAAEIAICKLASFNTIETEQEQDKLFQVAQEIDHIISDSVNSSPELDGMGTTLDCLYVRDRVTYWAHVGDSRIYLYRNNTITQITKDQTLGQFLLDEGEITHEELLTHDSNHLLEQCIGCGFAEPATGMIDLFSNDLLILTTDGLHNCMNEEIMAFILNGSNTIKDAAKRLVNKALEDDGKDNITIVIAGIL